MNKKLLFSGILVCLLVFSLFFVGCPQPTDDPSRGEYHLIWGTTFTDQSDVLNVISNNSWTAADYGIDWVLGTGSDATNAYNWCNTPANVGWDDAGTFDGTFEQCVNFTKNGVGAPQALKTAAITNKNNAPLACIYDYQGQYAVLCYVTKN
jgi:hypothetical protein